jgi:hypothetical protein
MEQDKREGRVGLMPMYAMTGSSPWQAREGKIISPRVTSGWPRADA